MRNLSKDCTPFITECLKTHSWSKMLTVPSNEVLSTVITGMNPHEHGIWQLKMKESAFSNGEDSFFDGMPDAITIVLQSVRHQLFHNCDIPTIPPRRRRAFELRRLKFHGRVDTRGLLSRLGHVPSIVSCMEDGDVSYLFTDRLHDQKRLLNDVANGMAKLEILQFHALDMLGHWQLDTTDKLQQLYRNVDKFLFKLYEKCESNGIHMVMLSDHGQERVIGEIDLKKKINEIDVPESEYNYYMQPMQARFWFHSNRARDQILKVLTETAPGTILHFGDLRRYNINFKSPDYGEVYFVPEPGYLLFPHDFHHPLVNLVFGLKDSQQRNRIWNPRHIAYHGYLPHHDSEKGWMLMTDDSFKLAPAEINAADIAPTLLRMVGQPQPEFMTGTCRLQA